jgi:hypothetical protein
MDTVDNLLQPIVNKLTHSLMLLFDKPRSFIRYRIYTTVTCLFGAVYAAFSAHTNGIVYGCSDLIIFATLTYFIAWAEYPHDTAAESKGLCMPEYRGRWLNVSLMCFTLTIVVMLMLFGAPRLTLLKNVAILLFWLFHTIWVYSRTTPPNPPAKVVLQAVRVGAR